MKQHESGLWIPDYMTGPNRYLVRAEICDRAAKHCTAHDVVIQAGGHLGIWPMRLAALFEKVITVEPERVNIECLRANVKPFANIEVVEGVLGAKRDRVKLNYRDFQSGAHHIATRTDRQWIEVPQYTIDDYAYSQMKTTNLIMLDIEGYEYFALHGGLKFIRRRHPVIVIEQNNAARMHHLTDDAAQKLLEREGYKIVERFDEDLIMVHG